MTNIKNRSWLASLLFVTFSISVAMVAGCSKSEDSALNQVPPAPAVKAPPPGGAAPAQPMTKGGKAAPAMPGM